MKTLQVIPSVSSESGGPVRSMLANCRALQGADPQICQAIATTDQGLQPRWTKSLREHMPPGMELRAFPAVGRAAFTFSPRLTRWLYWHISEFDLVVVRALFHPISSVAAGVARYHMVPYLLVPHGTLSLYTYEHRRSWLKRAYARLIERWTLEGAAALRFTSKAERDEVPAWARWRTSKVVPHPYMPRFEVGENRIENPGQVLFLSRWAPKKGMDILLKAFRRVRGELPEVRLVLAGSGTSRFSRQVRSEIERLGLRNAVETPGFVEGQEKTRLLRNSAVFVLPSHHENFGIAAVEAMDAGLPIIISRGVDIWPEVQDDGAGIVLEKRTSDCLASALLRLLRDSNTRQEMGRRGQDLVRSRFRPEQIGRELAALYRSAAGRSSSNAETA